MRGLGLAATLLGFVVSSGVLGAGSVHAGSFFLTAHDPDFHSARGGNTVGARNINTIAIGFVRDSSSNPFTTGTSRFLFVESSMSPPTGHAVGRAGIVASSFVEGVDFDHHDASTLEDALDELGSLYDAIVVASDFGGVLTQAELDILVARSADIIDFLNQGGGLYAMAESNNGQHLTPDGGHFGYLPFVVTGTALDQREEGNRLTPFGTSLGLTVTDVNGNASHNVFDDSFGLQIVDTDDQGRILSLAGRGRVDEGGVATPTPTVTPTVTATPTPSPTPSSVPTTVQPSPSPVLDHFKCYRVNKPRGEPRFEKREVVLADEFETKVTVVGKPTLLCNPVDKNGEGINDPTAHLSCYKIKDVRGQSKRFRSDVSVENQFDGETLRVGRPNVLCVPSTKEGVSSALNLDHFKCYKATKAKGSAKFQERDLLLADQFETKVHEARRPSLFCNAVDKDGEGILDQTAHLECYDLKRISKRCVGDTPPALRDQRCGRETDCGGVRRETNRCAKQARSTERVVESEDQFGAFRRRVRNARLVCVPTRRID